MALIQIARKNKATVIAGVAIAVALFAAFTLLAPGGEADISRLDVVIHDGDGNDHVLPLAQDGELVVETGLGANTIVVSGGQARVSHADCPNGDCMRQLPVSQPGQQLICMPHRLWVEVVEHGHAGGAMDEGAVRHEGGNAESDGLDTVAR